MDISILIQDDYIYMHICVHTSTSLLVYDTGYCIAHCRPEKMVGFKRKSQLNSTITCTTQTWPQPSSGFCFWCHTKQVV